MKFYSQWFRSKVNFTYLYLLLHKFIKFLFPVWIVDVTITTRYFDIRNFYYYWYFHFMSILCYISAKGINITSKLAYSMLKISS